MTIWLTMYFMGIISSLPEPYIVSITTHNYKHSTSVEKGGGGQTEHMLGVWIVRMGRCVIYNFEIDLEMIARQRTFLERNHIHL